MIPLSSYFGYRSYDGYGVEEWNKESALMGSTIRRGKKKIEPEIITYKNYNFLYFFATLIGLVIIIMSFELYVTGTFGFPVKDISMSLSLHIFLSMSAFLFLYGQSLLYNQSVYAIPKWFGLSPILPTFVISLTTFIFDFIVLIIVMISLFVLVGNDCINAFPIIENFTLHKWLGVMSIILLILHVIVSLLYLIIKSSKSKLHKERKDYLTNICVMLCWNASTFAFFLSMLCCTTGFIQLQAYFEMIHVPNLLRNYSNNIALLVLLFGLLILFLLDRTKNLNKYSELRKKRNNYDEYLSRVFRRRH